MNIQVGSRDPRVTRGRTKQIDTATIQPVLLCLSSSTYSPTTGLNYLNILWVTVDPYLTSWSEEDLKYSVPQKVTSTVSNDPSAATSHGFLMNSYNLMNSVS